jgi:polysaccharide export outer membrane protein
MPKIKASIGSFMKRSMNPDKFRSKIAKLLCAGLVLCSGANSAPQQSSFANAAPQQQNPPSTVNASSSPLGGYKIGTGDVLSIAVADASEFGGKFRVSDAGTIEIAGLSQPIQAEGLTTAELARSIRQALLDANQLRDPKVNVFVDEFRGRTVTVLGAVSKAAVYPLQQRTTILEALSMAGGPLPGAGNTVTVVRGAASAEATNTTVGSVLIMDMSRVLNGTDTSANVQVMNGDVVSVAASQVVYVVGAVIKPGGFTLTNPASGMSVVQAVAMAEGFTRVAATNRGLIIRQSTSESARQEIPADISKILSGQSTDMLLAPNDILFIPESNGKKTLRAMYEVAMAAAQGAAIYGVGYRAAGIAP